MADEALLAELEAENKQFDKDAEIDRIMSAFKLDAYAVLDLQPGVPESDIKACYRKKSLLIHPDKTSNRQAPDAFDRLKKAYDVLMDEKQRESLDEAIADARMLLMREKKLTRDDEEVKSEEFAKEWRVKTREVLIENELRRRKQLKAQMREEGRAQKQEEQEIEDRKRKRAYEDAWEKSRDVRIDSWRSFQKGVKPAKQATEAKDSKDGKQDGGVKKQKKVKKMKLMG
jgi:DnaJ family protein C protein 8